MQVKQIVDSVLRRLRECGVTSVSNDDYGRMALDYVWDALQFVEKAHDWTALRTRLTATGSVVTGNTVTLPYSAERFRVETLWSSEETYPLPKHSRDYMYYKRSLGGTGPSGWTLDSTTETSQVLNILPGFDPLSPPTFTADGILYTDNFSLNPPSNIDTYNIPIVAPQAVIHYALAYLSRERGDMGAQNTQEWYAMADRYLSDAIAMDANQHPEDLIFRAV